MCCKKLILAGVIAAVAAVGLKSTKFFGYAKTEAKAWQEWADDQVPVEKKIAALRGEVTALDADIEKVTDLLAREIVDARNLSADTAKLEKQLAAEYATLETRGKELKVTEKAATEKVSTRAATDLADAKASLKADVASYTRRTQTLDNMKQALGFHEKNRDVLQKQLDTLVAQQKAMKGEIDAFEVEYKTHQLKQMENKYQHDDTRLSAIKESLRKMRTNLNVKEEKAKLITRTKDDYQAAAGQSVDDILAPLAKPKTGESRE